MKTIDAALTAAQKTGAGAALMRATLADNSHLHPASFNAGAPAFSAAVNTGTEIVRVRAIGGAIDVQRITDPTVAANWTSWTALVASGVINTNAALFWTGTYVVLVWEKTGNLLRYRRSADGGQTWSVEAAAYAPAAALDASGAIAGVSGGAAQSGVFWGIAGVLYWGLYNPAADTWAAAASNALAATTIAGLAAAWDSANSRWLIAVTANFTSIGYNALALLTRSAAGAWSSPRIWYRMAGLNQTITMLSFSQARINGYWWLSATLHREWATDDDVAHYTASDDGQAFEDFQSLGAVANAPLVILAAMSGYVWMAIGNLIYRSAAQTYWTNKSLTHYLLDTFGDFSEIEATLNNQDGTITEPKPLALLTLERGYNVNGTDYYVSAGQFHLLSWHWGSQDLLCEVRAVDALGLAAIWRADQLFRWDSERLDKLVELVCALCGVHTVTFDAAAAWDDVLASFAIQIGTSALAALKALSARGNFDARVNEDGSLYCYVPTAAPAAQYTYGYAAGQHTYWPGKFGRGAPPNHLIIFGLDETFTVESLDQAAEADAGRRLPNTHREERASAAENLAVVASRLVLAKEMKRTGLFEAPPSLSLEPGDVLAFGDFWEGDNGPWRVLGFVEELNGPRRDRKYYQRVTLRGVA